VRRENRISPGFQKGNGTSHQGHHDAIIIMMRTTLNLPEDVYEAARALANLKRVFHRRRVGRDRLGAA